MTLKIVGISSSLRPSSVSRAGVVNLLAACQAQGAETNLIDLRQQGPLPFCDGRPTEEYGAVVQGLQKRLQTADALIVGTPEYHGGYSGVLKNFLDLNDTRTFQGKPVALVGAGGGRWGAESALNQLAMVFKNLRAICFPVQTSFTPSDVNREQVIVNPELRERLVRTARDFVTLAHRITGKPLSHTA